jgi:hypothetical protein
MLLMSRWRNPYACLLLVPVCLALSCSRPNTWQSSDDPQANQAQVPFDGSAQPGTASLPHADSIQSSRNTPAIESTLPFQNLLNLPAGTLLTVRLVSPISADESGAKGPFDAIVDDAVVVDNVIIIPRGAGAAGLVESARTSRLKRDRGYIRLTLASIQIAGRKLPVQTSSLFAKGTPSDSPAAPHADPADVVYLGKGRRLTFRLAGPLILASQQEALPH